MKTPLFFTRGIIHFPVVAAGALLAGVALSVQAQEQSPPAPSENESKQTEGAAAALPPELQFEPQEPTWDADPDPKSNEAIKRAVNLAFVTEPLAYATSPQIAVQDQVVTLTGLVASEEAKQAAERAARSVPEVEDVQNQIEVRPPATNTAANTTPAQPEGQPAEGGQAPAE